MAELNSFGGLAAGLVAVLTALGGGYKLYSESRRQDKNEELQRQEIAAKLGVEFHQSANKMLADFAERQQKSLDEANAEIAALKQKSTQDFDIILNEIKTLRADNILKAQQIERLRKQVALLVRQIKDANLPLPEGVDDTPEKGVGDE